MQIATNPLQEHPDRFRAALREEARERRRRRPVEVVVGRAKPVQREVFDQVGDAVLGENFVGIAHPEGDSGDRGAVLGVDRWDAVNLGPPNHWCATTSLRSSVKVDPGLVIVSDQLSMQA